ncbi:permease [Thermicanus aegyptius]|uniref:permease n=1 Tax=Thermicanus aegyptius TaxID=94009 RepID=UPI000409ADE5|nr:permease [Thermicanus aegyptius]
MIWEIVQNFFWIGLELTAFFIGITFLIQLLQGLIPIEKLKTYMFSENVFLGAAVSLLLAFVTPFCSCSTIPIVVSLLNQKIRFGYVMIFLFASPLLDPTIFTLMAATLGIKVSVVYLITTSLFSVLIGFMLERLRFEKQVKKVMVADLPMVANKLDAKGTFMETIHLLKSVYPYLIIGVFLGAVIHGAVPAEWISMYLGGGQWWLVTLAALIGIPLYIRLSTMIPISQILIAKGMALAPVMALIISSTGASLPEVAMLHSIFHKRLVAAFLLSVFSMATLSGLLFYLL